MIQPPNRPNKAKTFIKIHREITERAPANSQLSEYLTSQVNSSLDRSLVLSKHVSKNSNHNDKFSSNKTEFIAENESIN
jgi:hypothetical protein